MDTKLKNRHKLFEVLFLIFEWILAAVLMGNDYWSMAAAVDMIRILFLISAAGAWIFPLFKSFQTGQEKLFHIPAELAILLGAAVVAYALDSQFPYYVYNKQLEYGIAVLEGFAFFSMIYWVSGSLRQIWVMGVSSYLKNYSLIVRYGKKLPKLFRLLLGKGREGAKKLYRSFADIDFADRNNRTILKIVAVNFVILLLISSLWWSYGIFALLAYSILLFAVLRKYFNDLKDKYARVLDVTNRMAGGDLKVELAGDWGVFNSFKEEIRKIQEGYRAAVDKEVKSQKMKTELITNVSHDLKTPLTAIITYVDLLKEETDPEKQKEYIAVLERKSLRLKVLIEDLFEVSKAASQNVTLDIVNLDVVNLFKQVKLELDEQFQEAGLEFRCTWPEEKLICPLDSQKTYRIFENLLVNIARYAMKGTRVYVKIFPEGNQAVIQLLNISAEEITADAETLTQRFVRGDSSRNTEGSGLGLAIVRSFTELQKGTLRLQVEGDLFKAEVRFLMWEESGSLPH